MHIKGHFPPLVSVNKVTLFTVFEELNGIKKSQAFENGFNKEKE